MSDGSTALTRVGRNDVANVQDLVDAAYGFAVNSRSERTKREYARCWRQYCDWCDAHGQLPLPASVETLTLYVTSLATQGGPKGKPLSASAIDQALSALRAAHSMKGVSTEPFTSPILRETLKGVRRKIASERTIRRVEPLMEQQLSELLDILRPNVLREARDAAVLALGFGAARRRSELIALDYISKGDTPGCRGVLSVDERGISIRLMTSKTNQEGAEETYLVPRMMVPRLCAAVEHWLEVAGIEEGTPVFRRVRDINHAKGPQSGYVGVTWHELRGENGKWQAHATIDGKRKFLGCYDDAHEAHLAICKATGAKLQKPYAGAVRPERMTGASVARLVKARIGDLLRARTGKKRAKPDEIARAIADYSGHSMRAGLVTSAADRGVSPHHIKAVTGHKSTQMIDLYSRAGNAARNPTLKGSGL